MDWAEEALKWFGGIGLTIGLISSAAWALFRIFGEKWLDNKFGQRLAELQHSQRTELEAFRIKAESLIDRATKLNQREIDVLPRIWSLMNEAWGAVHSFTHFFQEYPDLDRMSKDEIKDILEDFECKEWQKAEILELPRKNERFQEIQFWIRFNKVNQVFRKFNNFYVTNSIFLTDDIEQKIDELRTLMNHALIEARTDQELKGQERGDFRERHKDRRKLQSEGPEKLQSLRKEIRGRLWEWRDELGGMKLESLQTEKASIGAIAPEEPAENA